MTNGFADYEHASWQQRQAESISVGVSCWLTLAQYTSLLEFAVLSLEFDCVNPFYIDSYGKNSFGSRTASRNGLSS
jgi:hypothetical protein